MQPSPNTAILIQKFQNQAKIPVPNQESCNDHLSRIKESVSDMKRKAAKNCDAIIHVNMQ